MAKGKPSRAFLEALQQEKRRRGDDKPGGGFATPEWFFKKDAPQPPAAPAAQPLNIPVSSVAGPMVSRRKGLKLTWKHGAIAAVVLVAGVGLAIVATRDEAPPKLGPAVEQVQAQVPNSKVLDVTSPRPAQAQPVQPPAHRPAPTPPPVAANPAPTPAGGAPAVAAVTPASSGRVMGMNYVVFIGFPKDHEKLAQEAAAALNAAGIGATVEQGIAGYSWYTVVGTTGFARVSTPEYQEYIRKSGAVSDSFAGNVKWKRFQPVPRKWQ